MSTFQVGRLILFSALVSGAPAAAQLASENPVAPVPHQLLAARRVFISNAGAESYGSETYFRLTKYDGGPDRFYNQLYAAMKNWGRYELADSPSTADVVYEARFTSPIVDKRTKADFVYDPQLGLTILDPKTRVALWSLTEHIQPGGNRESDNRNFDSAVERVVSKAKMLVEAPIAGNPRSSLTEFAPAGAIETARRQDQAKHATIGSAIGGLAGVLAASGQFHACPLGSSDGCGRGHALNTLGFIVGGAATGALIGWLWPGH
jgi:hypothetical protein